MEEMETEPITQEPGLYKPNTSRISSPLDIWTKGVDESYTIRISSSWEDIWTKERERLREQQQQLQMEEKKRKQRRVDQSQLISPSSQWEEYICSHCDNLMDDPIQTSCGHLMCYECFDQRRRWSLYPVRGDDGQEHEMSEENCHKDRLVKRKINKLIVKCDDCGPVTVKEYREQQHCGPNSNGCKVTKLKLTKFYESFAANISKDDLDHVKGSLLKHKVITHSQFKNASFEKLFGNILPKKMNWGLWKFLDCLLLDDHTGHSYESFVQNLQKITQEGCSNVASYILEVGHKDCMEMAVTWHGAVTELEKLSPDQQQEVLTQVLQETLPAAKHHLSIDEIRPLLIQNKVITYEEANELQGIFTGEEKITRLYTKMLPKKGIIGLEKYMNILFRTGLRTPSHLDHHSLLSKTLSSKLKQIMSIESILHQHKNEEAAKEAIVPIIYSESLPDAVVNLSQTINKLLLPMFKEDLVSISEFFGLRQFFHSGIFYHEEKVEDLYMILPQKGVEGLKGFMKVLQDTGRRIPSHQEHLNLMTSTLQFTCLSKTVDKVKWIESVASDLHDHGVVDGTQDSGVPVIYSESLPDAVVNLSRSINKLLLPMLKKQVIITSEYYWLREQQSPEEKVAILYKVILPQKGVKGLQDYIELLQDTGKNIPRHQKHVNLMKSKL